MQADQTTFWRLFNGERQFVIPLYQRPYSWERRHRQVLLNDINDVIEHADSPENHFLGSLVLAPPAEINQVRMLRSLVVDGQQRLTSLYILMVAIRDRFQDLGLTDRSRQVMKQQLTNEYQQGDLALKLLPTQADRSTINYLVFHSGPTPGPSNIMDAYTQFAASISKSSEINLETLLEVVNSRLEFITISLQHDDNAYRIFESLNDKGMSLTQGDLLRNHIFMLLPTRAEFVYEHKWRTIEHHIGSDRIEHLAYLDMVLRGSVNLSKKSTYQAQKTRLERRAASEEDVEAFVDDLHRRSSYLAMVLDPSRCERPLIANRLRNLQRLENETTHPLSLLLLEWLNIGKVAEEDAAKSLIYAESYLVRRTLSGMSAAGVNRVFTQLVNELSPGSPIADQVRVFLSKPSRRWASDAEITKNVYSVPMYNPSRNATLRHVLLSLEESLGHKELGLLSFDSLTIEHIIPQVRPAGWEGPVISQNGEDVEILIHSIGNLTLTGANSEMGNRVFAQKREILRRSKLSINLEIAAHETWGTAEVIDRADELAKQIIKLWPGPVRDPASSSSSLILDRLSDYPELGSSGRETKLWPQSTTSYSHDSHSHSDSSSPPRADDAVNSSTRASRHRPVRVPPNRRGLGKVGSHVFEAVAPHPSGTELTIGQIVNMASSNYRAGQISAGAVRAWMDRNTSGLPEFDILWGSTPLKVRRR